MSAGRVFGDGRRTGRDLGFMHVAPWFQSVLAPRDDDDMDMVGHQAISPNLRAGPSGGICEQIGVEDIVAILEERLLPAVAALGHVVRVAGRHEAGKASHGADVA